MGRYINVDLNALRSAKSAMLNYSIERKRLLIELKATVESTGKVWKGEDNEAFLLRWNGMSAADGVLTVTTENVDNYRKILSAAYKAYEQAQSESVEQASKIGGWT